MLLLGEKDSERSECGFKGTQVVFLVLAFFSLQNKLKLIAHSNGKGGLLRGVLI